jgi:hypothetical protein
MVKKVDLNVSESNPTLRVKPVRPIETGTHNQVKKGSDRLSCQTQQGFSQVKKGLDQLNRLGETKPFLTFLNLDQQGEK